MLPPTVCAARSYATRYPECGFTNTVTLFPPSLGPIFYMRKKVQKDLFNATEELARFSISDW